MAKKYNLWKNIWKPTKNSRLAWTWKSTNLLCYTSWQ